VAAKRKAPSHKGPVKIVSAGGILKTERGLTKAAKKLVSKGAKASQRKLTQAAKARKRKSAAQKAQARGRKS